MDFSFVVTCVLGGCCSNVWAYEALLRTEPRIGSALTFCQMLFIALQQLPSHLSWTPLPRLKPRQVPLSRWLLQVVVFATGSLLNNLVYAFHVPLTVQIVFRSAGLAISMLFGRLLLRKHYSFCQLLAVALVSLGVIIATLSRPLPNASSPSMSPFSGENATQYALGIAMLTASLFLTGILGILQEQTYQKYGPCWREGIFYTHALSLPAFLFLVPQVKYGLNSLSEASNGDVSSRPYLLVGNLLSQLVCVSGVNQLTSRVSSVSTQVVLTTRKAISLVFSVWWFGSGWNVQLGLGASMVFIGSLWYTRINAVVETLSKGTTPHSSPMLQTPSKLTPGKRV
ncbi:UAA transporter [Dentipellis sp. KUC8613]|nr:UAA transporter [Dentipellis sp. KUC8613]